MKKNLFWIGKGYLGFLVPLFFSIIYNFIIDYYYQFNRPNAFLWFPLEYLVAMSLSAVVIIIISYKNSDADRLLGLPLKIWAFYICFLLD